MITGDFLTGCTAASGGVGRWFSLRYEALDWLRRQAADAASGAPWGGATLIDPDGGAA